MAGVVLASTSGAAAGPIDLHIVTTDEGFPDAETRQAYVFVHWDREEGEALAAVRLEHVGGAAAGARRVGGIELLGGKALARGDGLPFELLPAEAQAALHGLAAIQARAWESEGRRKPPARAGDARDFWRVATLARLRKDRTATRPFELQGEQAHLRLWYLQRAADGTWPPADRVAAFLDAAGRVSIATVEKFGGLREALASAAQRVLRVRRESDQAAPVAALCRPAAGSFATTFGELPPEACAPAAPDASPAPPATAAVEAAAQAAPQAQASAVPETTAVDHAADTPPAAAVESANAAVIAANADEAAAADLPEPALVPAAGGVSERVDALAVRTQELTLLGVVLLLLQLAVIALGVAVLRRVRERGAQDARDLVAERHKEELAAALKAVAARLDEGVTMDERQLRALLQLLLTHQVEVFGSVEFQQALRDAFDARRPRAAATVPAMQPPSVRGT